MIFQWSRESRTWDLVAATGELLGTASLIPDDCWEAKMTVVGGGGHAWATDLERVKEWMMEEAQAAFSAPPQGP